jgi:hypothetical protein
MPIFNRGQPTVTVQVPVPTPVSPPVPPPQPQQVPQQRSDLLVGGEDRKSAKEPKPIRRSIVMPYPQD